MLQGNTQEGSGGSQPHGAHQYCYQAGGAWLGDAVLNDGGDRLLLLAAAVTSIVKAVITVLP
jgi:hypothetical protein